MPGFSRSTLLILLLTTAILTGCDDPEPAPKDKFRIGVVTNNPNGLKNIQGFIDGLATLGYAQPDKIEIVGPGRPVKGDKLVDELKNFVTTKVDLIFTAGTPTGVAAQKVTRGTNVPVVFGVIADPVSAGVLTNLSRPGGNMTGVMLNRDQAQRLRFLIQLLPGIEQIALLFNPNDAAPVSAVKQVEDFIRTTSIKLDKLECPTDDAVTECLKNLPDATDAIFLVPDSVVNRRVKDIIAVSQTRKIPVSGPSITQVQQGAVMAYGFIHAKAGAQAARIAAQLLEGGNPAETPVEIAESFLAVNMASAQKINLEIPTDLLQISHTVVQNR